MLGNSKKSNTQRHAVKDVECIHNSQIKKQHMNYLCSNNCFLMNPGNLIFIPIDTPSQFGLSLWETRFLGEVKMILYFKVRLGTMTFYSPNHALLNR